MSPHHHVSRVPASSPRPLTGRLLLTALLVLGGSPASAHAQGPSQTPAPATRQSALDRWGVWGSVGVGRASAGLRCATCANESTRAYTGHATLGVRVTPSFLVGAETFAWLDVMGGGTDRTARGTYLVARSYPLAVYRAFLTGGVGVARYELNDGEVRFATRAPSLSLGVGYDWRLQDLTITPTLTAVATTGGDLVSDRTGNAVTPSARLGLLRTAVALSWYR